MKRKIKTFTVLILFSVAFFCGTIFPSCEEYDEDCDWYVYDADGILTGYQDEYTCKEWAREYSDVTCSCR